MNIRISTNLSNHGICLLLLILMLHCSSPEQKSSSIELKVDPKLSSGGKIELTFNFISDREQQTLIDWDVLSIYNPSFEKDGLLTKKISLDALVDSLSYSQFIIENENLERRFFSDIKLFEGETIEMKSIFVVEPEIDTIHILPNKEVIIKSPIIDINRLKINQSDSLIRLYYLFKATEEQENAGYRSLVLTSDWFKLP